MSYNIKSTHCEVICNTSTEIKTDATVYEMKDVNEYIQDFVEQFTDYSEEGKIKIAVFHKNDAGILVTRLFYTYQDKEMVSFNKDNCRQNSSEEKKTENKES